jgi:hypothetical protein
VLCFVLVLLKDKLPRSKYASVIMNMTVATQH